MEQKLVLRFSTAYEKLEKIESKVAEVRNYIKHMWGDDDEHVDTLNHVLRMLDNHHGALERIHWKDSIRKNPLERSH